MQHDHLWQWSTTLWQWEPTSDWLQCLVMLSRVQMWWIFLYFSLSVKCVVSSNAEFAAFFRFNKKKMSLHFSECDPMACPPVSSPDCREDQFLVEVRGAKSCCYSYLCGRFRLSPWIGTIIISGQLFISAFPYDTKTILCVYSVCESCIEPIPTCANGEILAVDLNTTNSCCPHYHCGKKQVCTFIFSFSCLQTDIVFSILCCSLWCEPLSRILCELCTWSLFNKNNCPGTLLPTISLWYTHTPRLFFIITLAYSHIYCMCYPSSVLIMLASVLNYS